MKSYGLGNHCVAILRAITWVLEISVHITSTTRLVGVFNVMKVDREEDNLEADKECIASRQKYIVT